MTTSTSAGGRIDITGQRLGSPFRRNVVATLPDDGPDTWDVTGATVTVSSIHDQATVAATVAVEDRTLAVSWTIDTDELNPTADYRWEVVLHGSAPFDEMQLIHGAFQLAAIDTPAR